MCGETESMFVDASFGAFDRPSRPSEVRSSEVADFLSVGLAGWLVGWIVGLLAGWLVGWPLPRGWGPPKRGLYGARRGGRLLLLILLLLLRVGTVDVVVRQENGPGVVGTGALPSISSSAVHLTGNYTGSGKSSSGPRLWPPTTASSERARHLNQRRRYCK